VAAEIDDAALERRLFPSIDLAAEVARPLPDWNSVHKELERRGVTLQLV
jgi:transposase